MFRAFSVLAALTLACAAAAQSVMGEYHAVISPQDMVNSQGQRLGHFCAMVQQDRANYHRFGRRDPTDEGDPVFSDRTLRGRIVNTCELTGAAGIMADQAMRGTTVFIRVRILNDGGQMRVLVGEWAG
ncbi:hypothetical protein [Flavimaricola marinus]|uniref:Uncharacterized protein n=1 Tax=Flavimaricola marinus TaxID=1819565 RepID=A0A238LES5_9RHOB|nr:hypothetical protein [Flavimaricola marinus]SMY07914.1 hypothetical protein LOM8899_02059 [Flavimaricola marinus]